MSTTNSDFATRLVAFVRQQYETQEFIPLHAPRLGELEKQYVVESIESGFVSSVGKHVDQFEQGVADFTGSQYAIATVNGTAALHVALLLSGLAQGDEVVTQALTFVATCNAIRYCGAEPVFVDVERRTLGMCPDSLAEFLSTYARLEDDGTCRNLRTGRIIRTCVPMHTNGHPANIQRIRDICEQHNIVLVEDAAESLGSLYAGCHTGRFGQLGVLSFNGNKIITTGGGGMILTDDGSTAQQAKHLTTTAKRPHPYLYIHDTVGYNYRLPSINAALGCAQLRSLPEILDKKRALANRYAQWFAEQGYEFIHEPDGARSNYWFNSFLANSREERDAILEYTNAHSIMTRPVWTPMHHLDLYRECCRMELATTEWIEARLVNVPSSVPPK